MANCALVLDAHGEEIVAQAFLPSSLSMKLLCNHFNDALAHCGVLKILGHRDLDHVIEVLVLLELLLEPIREVLQAVSYTHLTLPTICSV